MKAESIHIENYRRVKLIEFMPEGELIVIGGRNGQGKTSVLDAIANALGGTKPKEDQPVRRGEDAWETDIITDNGLRIRQRGTKAGTYSLRVTSAEQNMNAAEPASFLKRFYNKLSFDPLAFARMAPGEQGEALRKLLGLDFADLDLRRRNLFESRTKINHEVDMLDGQLEAAKDYDPDAPDEPQTVDSLVEELNAGMLANQQRSSIEGELRRARLYKASREAALEEAKKMLADATDALGRAEAAAVTAPELVDTDAIRDRIRDIEQLNARAQRKQAHVSLTRRREAVVADANDLTARIRAIDDEKREAIAGAEFPVLGLGFDEDGRVLFNGLPFDQAAESEKLRVSATIGLEMGPELRVLLVRDGSLLDDESMAELEALAIRYDAQIFVERVGTEGAQIVLEDGELANG